MLIHLADGHTDIQKLIAFDDAFGKVFTIIESEGGIEGGIVVEDCLELLSSLLAFNGSNQSYFRETGFVPRLAKLLAGPISDEEVPEYAAVQRNMNLVKTLAVIRLFVVPGSSGASANQVALASQGVLNQIVQLAFSSALELDVRAEALRTVADLIQGSPELQNTFAGMVVPSSSPEPQEEVTYVIEALLDLTLLSSATETFNARLSASHVLTSYFSGNAPLRMHFLRRVIDGYLSGEDNTANVLSCLLDADSSASRNDPYRIWFAGVIFMDLLHENDECKDVATECAVGDESQGEERVSLLQMVSAALVSSLNTAADVRITLAYLMLLCTWTYESPNAVNDFLSEGSTLQSLIVSVVETSSTSHVLAQGLTAYLLGTLYEFSSKASPIPRAQLHAILTSRLGHELFTQRLERLRRHPAVRDFEVRPQWHAKGRMGVPEVFFTEGFITFLKDDFSRILRSLSREPGTETHRMTLANLLDSGISPELVDSLRAQIQERDAALEEARQSLAALRKEHDESVANSKRTLESTRTELTTKHSEEVSALKDELALTREELDRTKDAWTAEVDQLTQEMENSRKSREEEVRVLQERIRSHVSGLIQKHEEEMAALRREKEEEAERVEKVREEAIEKAKREHAEEVTKVKAELEGKLSSLEKDLDARTSDIDSLRASLLEKEAEMEKLRSELSDVQKKYADEHKSAEDQISSLVSEVEDLESQLLALRSASNSSNTETTRLQSELDALKSQLSEKDKAVKEAQAKVKKAEEALKEKEVEVDDIMMLLEESERKKDKYKEVVKEKGGEVSEDEDDDDDDEDGEE